MDPFVICVCLYHTVMSLSCSLVVTCWEKAGLCDVFLCVVRFPYDVLGQLWYLIVSIPDICLLYYASSKLTRFPIALTLDETFSIRSCFSTSMSEHPS